MGTGVRTGQRHGGQGPKADKARPASATVREFLASLGRPVTHASFDDAVDALLDGIAAPPPHPELAGAAIALGRAVDAAGGMASVPRRGPAIILVSVPSATWVEPVATVVDACIAGNGWAGERAVVFQGDGSAAHHAPDKRNGEVAEGIRGGSIVVGVSQDPKRLLPRDLVRVADCRLDILPLHADDLSLLVEAVTGVTPRTAVDAELVPLCDPDDLSLTVHVRRGADASVARLTSILAAKAAQDVAGPRLEDLHGYQAAQEWGRALVADLAAWKTGSPGCPRWSDLESAILLSGPPGVGKTTFAAALARSAGLPFLSGSLPQWQSARDGHLGHTLGAMRAFFERARRAPCVALIDEIDSFGDRAKFHAHHRDYSSQVLNGLLEHLDGALSREGVVIVAATNFPERLDPALLRPGRLDRHVRIDLPDLADLERILRHHLGRDLPELSPSSLALRLAGMSGADVEGLVRRARGIARRSGRTVIVSDLEAATDELRPALPEQVRRRIAWHEAGHLVAAEANGMPGPLSASIRFDGGTASIGLDAGPGIATEAWLNGCLVMMLAGRAAEEVMLGDVTTGAVEDLASATHLALMMETRFGFSARMPLVSQDGKAADLLRSPPLAEAVTTRLSGAYSQAFALMQSRRRALRKLADHLFAHGRIGDAETRRHLRSRSGRGNLSSDRSYGTT